jgi:hypothetical protein
MMKRIVHLGLVLAIAAAAAGCGQSEKAGPATVTEVSSSAPAATPDPHPPIAMFNTPGEKEAVDNKSWCTGWALDDSGIADVSGTLDTGSVAPARIGMPFPGVKEAYPTMPDNDRAGFMFQIPDLPPGAHTIKLQVVAKDGGKVILTRSFTVK